MSKHFKAKVNNAIDFDFSEDDILKLDALQTSKEKYHILKDNTSFKAEIVEADFNKKSYTVKVNNNSYNVNIFNELDLLIKDMGFSVGTTKQINSILAPMSGLILEINVEVGQEVNENDNLLILEAMKMENEIKAGCDGVVKTVNVSEGQAIESGHLMVEIEE